MKIIESYLDPATPKIENTFKIKAFALRDIGLRDAEDLEIFKAAKAQDVILMTKDSDFADLVGRLDAPPKIVNRLRSLERSR